MKIGVLAVQGAFIEHEKVLARLGVQSVELRQKSDIGDSLDGLILPGGESTVQGKLIKELGMFRPLREIINAGVPTLATCAGMILLAEEIEGQDETYFGTLPVTVKRNAYGRQLGSFHTDGEFKTVGTVPMTFIRAPYVTEVSPETEITAEVGGKIVGVKYKNQIAVSFHPELDDDTRIHEALIKASVKR